MRILVIKTGETELLVDSPKEAISLGEAFRSGVILSRLLKRHRIFWVGPEALKSLWPHHPHLTVMSADASWPDVDAVINLERVRRWAIRASRVPARGFFLDSDSRWKTRPRVGALEDMLKNPALRRINRRPHPFWLFALCGLKWRGERYWSYRRLERMRKKPLVGFNFRVGKRWPEKAWPLSRWEELEGELEVLGFEISWQPQGSIEGYREWIRGLDAVVSSDSLGLHLAVGMGVPAVGLFAPTFKQEVPKYGACIWLDDPRGMRHEPARVCRALRCLLKKRYYLNRDVS